MEYGIMIIPPWPLAPDYSKGSPHPTESCPTGCLKSPHWSGTEMASDTELMSCVKSRDVPLSTCSSLDHCSPSCFPSVFKECLDLWHNLYKQTRHRSSGSRDPQDRPEERARVLFSIRGLCFACSPKVLPGFFILNSGYVSPFCFIAAAHL